MEIKVLGTGCAKCAKLFKRTEEAVAEAGVAVDLEKVEALDDIINYGVMMTPALVINGEVKCSGKIPKNAEIVSWITDSAK